MSIQPVDRTTPVVIPPSAVTELRKKTLAARDTIGEAPVVPPVFIPSKPQLPLYRAILNAEREYQVGNKLLELNMNQLDQNYLELDECRLQMAQQIKENIEKTKNADFWDILKKIGTCILSAISTVIGISLVGTAGGTLIGGALIASGVLAIANLALMETGLVDQFAKYLAGEDEELKKFYATVIPGSFGLVSGILGAAGAAAGWSSINFVTQALSIAQAAAGIADGALTLGRGVTRGELKWNEAKRSAIQKTLTLNAHDTDKVLSGIENFMEQRNRMIKATRHCLASFAHSMNKALQI
jgi:hypothetical protein